MRRSATLSTSGAVIPVTPLVTTGSIVMDRFQYLILMGLCLVLTLPLEFIFGARVWRRPRRLLVAIVPTAAVFIVWDVIAVARDHWGFNPKYTTGWDILPGFPVDEVMFFLAVPMCALLTLEAVRNVLARFGKGDG